MNIEQIMSYDIVKTSKVGQAKNDYFGTNSLSIINSVFAECEG